MHRNPLPALTLLLTTLLAPALAAAQTLVFTAIPDEDETRLQQRFQAVADYLAETLEIEVRFIPVTSYAASVTAFRNNQVQLAWFGGFTGVQARQLVPGSRAIAQGVEDPDYKSYFIANQATGLEPHDGDTAPEGLRDLTFSFGSQSSTSGRLLPEYFLREHLGGSPDELFTRVGFSGNHSRTISVVQSGAYQAGVVSYKAWENELEAGNIDLDRVQVIWESPPYPDYQWTVRGDVDERFGEGFTEHLQQALLDMEDPDLLASFPRAGFIPAENDDYQEILEVAQSLGLLD
ncbi:putative selenate ABC transporter substrate-binding protein [Halomonas campisalis]|uniref:Selenate ABC transporter substrate-binding protein n=1 Tax=Billgrantia campisalis TaxID=74661 RepID=A0ABS9PCB9_9GAMM|nr:putative selenate ABC transporter substrate-binding protein [Halomonas campisalis]MCG6659099.1 putative selenate ABC transporter substrate-binding protein [Halomonas campisalis]MDR5863867.1 putative selenate ABC transporter substrate-binding protein [Halomonas campisalis]